MPGVVHGVLRSCLGYVVLLALCVAPAGKYARADAVNFANAIKANYVFKFAPFVVWPERALEPASNAFTICIAGDDPFGAVLDDVIQGQMIHEHPVVALRLTSLDKIDHCQILYTGTLHWNPEFTAAIKHQPVLTIAEDSANNGAMVQFVLVDGRVRFKVDAAAAASADLTLSSKLLSLAVAVRRPGS